MKEYYYDSRREGRQKTDAEYLRDLRALCGGRRVERVIVDPSAASFLAALRAHDAALAKQRMREHWLRAMQGCLNETIAYLGQNEA